MDRCSRVAGGHPRRWPRGSPLPPEGGVGRPPESGRLAAAQGAGELAGRLVALGGRFIEAFHDDLFQVGRHARIVPRAMITLTGRSASKGGWAVRRKYATAPSE